MGLLDDILKSTKDLDKKEEEYANTFSKRYFQKRRKRKPIIKPKDLEDKAFIDDKIKKK